ncbi:unnamed protein product [Cylindrotheca closterium]|uniref:Uncharacterized protein n=1 Tax=Cylindrotheca closterium TaxID=2856 RepID=A0AAD2PV40_9STRA|nr:unnamed protein product [Cylindrotheca closterium]
MTSHINVIYQNNATVALLRDQDASHAIVASSEALRCLRRCASTLHDVPANKSCTDSLLDQCMARSVTDQSQAESGKPFIFDRGIQIPLTTTDTAAISAILIFNSALSHQLWAAQNPADAPGYLTKARQLYELAYRMDDVEHNVMFQIAIMNNMVVIERSFGNNAESERDFGHLLSMWMLLLDLGYGSRIHSMRGFLVNGRWSENAAVA